jgi:hypothetical protein
LWKCDQCGAHVTVDGFQNAWIAQHPYRRVITLVYTGAYAYYSALVVSMLLALVALLLSCRLIYESRNCRLLDTQRNVP